MFKLSWLVLPHILSYTKLFSPKQKRTSKTLPTFFHSSPSPAMRVLIASDRHGFEQMKVEGSASAALAVKLIDEVHGRIHGDVGASLAQQDGSVTSPAVQGVKDPLGAKAPGQALVADAGITDTKVDGANGASASSDNQAKATEPSQKPQIMQASAKALATARVKIS